MIEKLAFLLSFLLPFMRIFIKYRITYYQIFSQELHSYKLMSFV